MNDFKLTDQQSGDSRYFDSRSDAEETKSDLKDLTGHEYTLESVNGDEPDTSTGTSATDMDERTPDDVEVIDMAEDTTTENKPDTSQSEGIPSKPPIDEDPVDWMPQHFVDTIQGVPTVNRKGYAVIASRKGISVTSEPVTLASETDFEYAEFKATATTESGETYSGFGSAHINRKDGDDQHLLNELAETRAMKRAVTWASGVGMTAVEEMEGKL